MGGDRLKLACNGPASSSRFRFCSAKLSLGIKGGGSRSSQSDSYTLEFPPSTRLPFLKSLENGDAPRTFSHRIWGGLTRQEAQVEFMHLLAVHDLMNRVEPEVLAAAPLPIAVEQITSIPVEERGAIHWVSSRVYRDKYLRGDEDELVTLLTVNRSNIRLGAALIAFGQTEFSEQLQAKLWEVLEHLYGVWGERLQKPAHLEFCTHEAVCDDRAFWGFVKQIFDYNASAATRIYERVLVHSLKTIAVVHGAGGHFGGYSEQLIDDHDDEHSYLLLKKGVGASEGGGPAVRNMSLGGDMSDLDSGAYLPWVPRPDLGATALLAHKTMLSTFQRADLCYWQQSMYWFRHLLMGRKLAPGQVLPETPFVDPQTGFWVIDVLCNIDEERTFALVGTDHKRQWARADLAQLYEEYKEKGRQAAPTLLKSR